MGHFIVYCSLAATLATVALMAAIIDGLAHGLIVETATWQRIGRVCLVFGALQAAVVLCVEHARSEVLRGSLAVARGVPVDAIPIERDRETADMVVKRGQSTFAWNRAQSADLIRWEKN